jgi:hypothetical protein
LRRRLNGPDLVPASWCDNDAGDANVSGEVRIGDVTGVDGFGSSGALWRFHDDRGLIDG